MNFVEILKNAIQRRKPQSTKVASSLAYDRSKYVPASPVMNYTPANTPVPIMTKEKATYTPPVPYTDSIPTDFKYRDLLLKYWGKDSPMGYRIMSKENGRFDPYARNVNKDGSVDLGLFQENDVHTVNPYLKNRPQIMQKIGITKFDDLTDAEKNIAFARALAEARGNLSAWYALDPDDRNYKLKAEYQFFPNRYE